VKAPVVARIWGAGGRRLLLGDALVLAALSAVVIALALPQAAGGRPARAEVQIAGQATTVLDLGRAGVTEIRGPLGATRVEVAGGRVRVLSSPCPRQDCRDGGWIGAPGEILVCLPNAIVIRIPGRASGALDAVSR
jgi:hypothetical protein